MKLSLLPRILIAITLGILLGGVMGMPLVRLFVTFNSLFGEFLQFCIPLIIVGLVTPAIADIGRGAGRLLLITVAIAYVDTIVAAILSYATGSAFFPSLIAVEKSADILPYFTLNIPAPLDVMTALVLSFILGLGIAYGGLSTLRNVAGEVKTVIARVIERVIIPLLPLYIFGIFLSMTVRGDVMRMMTVFAKIILVIFALHIFVLLYQYLLAGSIVRRNPFRLLATMFPAYLTALGTSSSAATIPVALRQTLKNGVTEGVAGFVIPLCATVHLSGSAMKITACALVLAIFMVAAPGVPGGAIMAALAPLGSILGFGDNEQALMIALYIAMDSFGTACNVTGDGAIALVVERLQSLGVKELKE